MTKELQDLVWSILPKEFKEEVKRDYLCLTSAYKAMLDKDTLTNPECDRCKVIREKISIYSMYFGHHNLTSDAEGEEMLTVSRKRVQELYNKLFGNPLEPVSKIQLRKDFQDLFGSKCLPNGNEDNFASKEPRIEDGEKESFTYPKFRTGDKVLFNNNICRIIGTDREDAEYQLERIIDNHLMGWAEENEISLYEEPEPAELFKIGSKVIYKRTNKVKIIKDITNKGMYIITTLNGQSPLYIDSFDIELLE